MWPAWRRANALTLLHRVVTRPLAARISDQIVTATDGNPLAIIDLAQELSTHQLAGLTLLPEPMPVGSHLQAHDLRQQQSLPENVQTWLLLAAAEPSGDPAYVAAAAAVLGIDVDAGDLAEARNLVRTDDRISFRHPLVRSAIYSGATGGQRRRVHNALAAVTRRATDVDRRAWHLAAGCTGPDEEVADVLEQAAGWARERGGYSARASLLARAVELSPDGPGKVGRTLDAAGAAMTAGRAMQTLAALATVPFPVALPDIRTAIDALRADDLPADQLLRFAWASVALTTAVWDDEARTTILNRAIGIARPAGAVHALDALLFIQSLCETVLGRLDSAGRHLNELRQVRDALGMSPAQQEMFRNIEYRAWLGGGGERDALLESIESSRQAAVALGLGGAETLGRTARMLVHLSDGNDEAAYQIAAATGI